MIQCKLKTLSECENKGETVEEKFLHFEVGTPRKEVLQWFEEEFDISVCDIIVVGENE